MKRLSKYLMLTGLSGLLCLFLAVPADAQRGGGHSGGGGGGSHGGGGGGGSHFSGGGGGGGFSRGGGNFSGGSRPSAGQSFNRGGSSRPQFNNSSPRTQTNRIQGNTRGFSNRGTGVNGNTRSFNRGVGVNGTRSFNRLGTSAYRGRGGVGVSSRSPGFYRSRAGNYGRGYRYSPWYSHRGYYYNRGLYRSSYYPRLGFSLGILPYGYYPFYWGADQFFYSGGYFYQYNDNQYTVVEPPIGAAINSLPEGAQSISINGQQYYELNGVYYEPITKDDGTVVYQVAGKDGQLDTDEGDGSTTDNGGGGQGGNSPAVAAPEIGDIFYSLPSDTRKIKINNQQYYVSPDDFYYQENRDQDNKKAYKVVGTPDDEPGN